MRGMVGKADAQAGRVDQAVGAVVPAAMVGAVRLGMVIREAFPVHLTAGRETMVLMVAKGR